MLTKENILETIEAVGYFIQESEDIEEIINELETQGLIVRANKIPYRHPKMLNPDYTFVANTVFGRSLAVAYALGNIDLKNKP